MASKLKVEAVWHDELSIIDPDDPVQGGADGVDNIPHVELMQNDMWLKTELAKALERIAALENKGTTTTGTGGTTTPTTTTPTGTWQFLYSQSPKLNDASQNPNDEWLIFTSQPIFWDIFDIWWQSDLPKVKRLPYTKYSGIPENQPYIADKHSNRVLVYVAKRGEQPDYTKLPLMDTYAGGGSLSTVLNAIYFGVTDTGKIYFEDVNGSSSPSYVSGMLQAEKLGIIKAGQTSPEQHWDTYYVFLLDEKADNLLTNEQITAKQWGSYHIEKITMCTRWDTGVGAYTVQKGSGVTPPNTSDGGNIATIEAQ